jgi:hypothetical protein
MSLRVTENAILQKASILKIIEIAKHAHGRHSYAEFFCIFQTHALPIDLWNIQGVDISINISVIMMSRDRIPESKMATAMLNVVNTPECYHEKKRRQKYGIYCSCDLHNNNVKLTT